MRLVWVVIPLLLIGVTGIQDVDARCFDEKYCFPNNIRVADVDGNSVSAVVANNQYNVVSFYPMESELLCYFGISVPLSLCPDHEFPLIVGDHIIEKPPEIDYVYVVQIKDENGTVSDLKWINGVATDIPTDISINWIPKKSGIYTIENFIWTSFDNPVIMTVPSFMSVTVEEGNSKTTLKNKSDIVSGCKDVGGIWLDKYSECETGSITESFENYCHNFNGDYNYCHSGCRHHYTYPSVICAAQCIAVCEFN